MSAPRRKQPVQPSQPPAASDDPAPAAAPPAAAPAAPRRRSVNADTAHTTTKVLRRNASVPEGAVVVATGAGYNGAAVVPAAAIADDGAAPPKATPAKPADYGDCCYIRFPASVKRKHAEEWARYQCSHMNVPIDLMARDGQVLAKYRPAELLAERGWIEYRPMSYPWYPTNFETATAQVVTDPVVAVPGKAPRRSATPAAAPKARTNGADGGPTKTQQIIELMKRPKGASIDELTPITGWGFGVKFLARIAETHKLKLNELGNRQYSFT